MADEIVPWSGQPTEEEAEPTVLRMGEFGDALRAVAREVCDTAVQEVLRRLPMTIPVQPLRRPMRRTAVTAPSAAETSAVVIEEVPDTVPGRAAPTSSTKVPAVEHDAPAGEEEAPAPGGLPVARQEAATGSHPDVPAVEHTAPAGEEAAPGAAELPVARQEAATGGSPEVRGTPADRESGTADEAADRKAGVSGAPRRRAETPQDRSAVLRAWGSVEEKLRTAARLIKEAEKAEDEAILVYEEFAASGRDQGYLAQDWAQAVAGRKEVRRVADVAKEAFRRANQAQVVRAQATAKAQALRRQVSVLEQMAKEEDERAAKAHATQSAAGATPAVRTSKKRCFYCGHPGINKHQHCPNFGQHDLSDPWRLRKDRE